MQCCLSLYTLSLRRRPLASLRAMVPPLPLLCISLWLTGATPGSAVAPKQIYVAVTGSDSHDGSSATEALKSIEAAQKAVRQALAATPPASDVRVNLGPGHYYLAKTLNLTLSDAPAAGGSRVTWAGSGEAPGSMATLSGGQPITFSAAAAGVPWQADVSALPAGAVALGRHLYVNGRRVARSTEPGSGGCRVAANSPCAAPLPLWGNAAWLFTNTSVEIINKTAAARALAWPNAGSGVEFVFTGVGGSPWAESRCQVESVSASTAGAKITMSEPCFSCWAYHCQVSKRTKIAAPTAIEAIGADNLVPGEWWLDRVKKVAHYQPLPGETTAATSAVMPVLEKLVFGSGSDTAKLSGISFSQISFQHATWFAPRGFVGDQGGQSNNCPSITSFRMPSNIAFHNCEGIIFDTCEFAHLGMNGVEFAFGAHRNLVHNSFFHDISGAALQIGRTDGATAKLTDAASQEIGNTLSNSIVTYPAVECEYSTCTWPRPSPTRSRYCTHVYSYVTTA